MVLLGTVGALLAQFRPTRAAARRAGIEDLLPLMILNWKKRRRRIPAPGWKISYRSVLLGRKLRVRATLSQQRAIERAGGFDRYIFYTPEDELRSLLAVTLKRRMSALVSRYPSIAPPPLDKRNPKPLPKKLPISIARVEVSDMKEYRYLG